jgi:hypothetical protein
LELTVEDEPDRQRAVQYVEAYNAVRPDPDGLAREAVSRRYITANPELAFRGCRARSGSRCRVSSAVVRWATKTLDTPPRGLRVE